MTVGMLSPGKPSVGYTDETVGGDGRVTVSRVEPLTAADVATIVAVPTASVLASPPELMLTTLGGDAVHDTEPVISWLLLSVKVPLAVNCCVMPRGRKASAGVTAIDTRAGADTVKLAEPLIVPEMA
jgi:hypothetical protein